MAKQPRASDTFSDEDVDTLISHLRYEKAAESSFDVRPWNAVRAHLNGQAQALASKHTYRILVPGNGYGKTTCMAMDADMLMQRDDPYKPEMIPDRPTTAIWVTQKYQQFEVMRSDLEEIFTPGWKWAEQKHVYVWPNGSKLFVLSSDSDWTAIQGVQIDAVYFDEHPDRQLWVELLYRRRGKKRTRYMVAATMTQGLTWFVRDQIQPIEQWAIEHGQTKQQRLRRQEHPTTFLWDTGGIQDNPSMTEEDFEHYESITAAGEKEKQVRLFGGYADFTGQAVFDQAALDQQTLYGGESGQLVFVPDEDDALRERLIYAAGQQGTEPIGHRFAGVLDRRFWSWKANLPLEDGRITIYEDPLEEEEGNYVIGADFAAGLAGKDYDAAVVGRRTREGGIVQVAEAHGHWGDIFFAEVLYSLGVWYLEAFICGERQFGLPALRRLYDEMGYVYLYHQRTEGSRARRFSDLLGHHRHAGDTILANARLAVKRGDVAIRSEENLTEHQRYQFRPRRSNDTLDDVSRSEDLKMGAPDGEHDDLVMATAYMIHAAREQVHFEKPQPKYRPGSYGDVFKPDDILRDGSRSPNVDLLR